MVVCTEYIDSLVVATGYELVIMICNVRHNICWQSVGTDEHNVFVVAVFTGFEPKCAVLLVCYALFFESIDNFLNGAVLVQRGFSEPIIIGDSVLFEISFEALYILRQSESDEGVSALLAVTIDIFFTVFCLKVLCVFHNVYTMVCVFGKFNILSAFLKVSYL